MTLKRIIAILLALNLWEAHPFDYCNKTLCPDGARHIACDNSGTLPARCPLDTLFLDVNLFIPLILKMHNEKRNTLAGGRFRDFEPAKRMAAMQWDRELASIAGLNVKQCSLNHDSCRNTQRFHYSGQNLGIMRHFSASLSNEYFIKFLINFWWNEITSASTKYIESYPTNYFGPTIAHFMVMATQWNTHVGCSAVRYSGDGLYFNFLLACNYATNTVYNRPVYLSGETASGCTTGRDAKYTNLCSIHEDFDINNLHSRT